MMTSEKLKYNAERCERHSQTEFGNERNPFLYTILVVSVFNPFLYTILVVSIFNPFLYTILVVSQVVNHKVGYIAESLRFFFKYTNNNEIAAGVIPGIREACPMVIGRCSINF